MTVRVWDLASGTQVLILFLFLLLLQALLLLLLPFLLLILPKLWLKKFIYQKDNFSWCISNNVLQKLPYHFDLSNVQVRSLCVDSPPMSLSLFSTTRFGRKYKMKNVGQSLSNIIKMERVKEIKQQQFRLPLQDKERLVLISIILVLMFTC